MKYNPDIHHRRSVRLKEYDYAGAGAYFITICTWSRECLFGNIVNGEMRLNDAGEVALRCWNDIPSHFPDVELDEFVVMPNHIHGILIIADTTGAGSAGTKVGARETKVGAKNFSPPYLSPPQSSPCGTSRTIGSIVRGFKTGVTKWMRNATPLHAVWQRSYWEHIIRNKEELCSIREYVRNNPEKWASDELFKDGREQPADEKN